jgi:hypothetical protein
LHPFPLFVLLISIRHFIDKRLADGGGGKVVNRARRHSQTRGEESRQSARRIRLEIFFRARTVVLYSSTISTRVAEAVPDLIDSSTFL